MKIEPIKLTKPTILSRPNQPTIFLVYSVLACILIKQRNQNIVDLLLASFNMLILQDLAAQRINISLCVLQVISYNKRSLWETLKTMYVQALKRGGWLYATSTSFWRGINAVTNDFVLGRSRGSYCKHREASRTSSVPSSFENCPSKQESVSIWRFLSRMRSRAWEIVSNEC